jgi:hypothetical protein
MSIGQRHTACEIPFQEALMPRKNNRSGSNAASSNQPAEPERRHESGGNMGAGKSGGKSFGAEKPEIRDNMGSREAGRDWDGKKE